MIAWIHALFLVILSAAGATPNESPAWHQFRGPAGSGVADAEHPPIEFGPAKNMRWNVPVPSGASSPIVVGDKLVMTAFDDGKLYTIAYNRADGSEAWRAHAPAKVLEPYHKTEGSPAASTPADRRRADRLVLRFLRIVLLRPRRPRAVEIRDADGRDDRRLRHRRVADCSSTASSFCCTTT